jgi:hypothetical protein
MSDENQPIQDPPVTPLAPVQKINPVRIISSSRTLPINNPNALVPGQPMQRGETFAQGGKSGK